MSRRPSGPVTLRSRTAARRIGLVYLAMSVVLVPWTLWLAWSLPSESVAHHNDIAWAGFDLLLLAGLATTGVLAMRRSRWLPVAATAAGTMLVVDAWFDVTTASRSDRMISLTLAVLVELPVAGLCLWLAMHGQDLMAAQTGRGAPAAQP